MSYLDKYKGQYGRNSVYDILALDPNKSADWKIIDKKYRAVDIEKVIIDGDTFTNYGDFQFVWEKSYVKSPSRSNAGVIDNLNSYATFVTPHLILNFSIMSIDDYRAIMRKDLERNEFIVECYDPIYNKRITVKMYFATPQMAKLYTIAKTRMNGSEWEDFVEIVGVHGYTVELIGTNADLDKVSVIYHLNPPADTGYADQTFGEDDVYQGEDIVIGGSASNFVAETFGGIYKFAKWNTSASGGEQGNYINDYSYTINSDLELYAQWDKLEEKTLTFNYGLADPSINESTYTYETSRKVVQGKSIGTLPTAQTPTVKAKDLNGNETTYTPYTNGAWYKTPIKIPNSVAVKNGDLYWLNRDSTIYLLYDVSKYLLNLYLDGSLYQTNSVEYNTPMNLPLLVKSGYTFDGWYYTADFQNGTKVSGLMPPYALTLYARWVAK
jgi:uncharacterized repeat protein (TIGR02543 family)